MMPASQPAACCEMPDRVSAFVDRVRDDGMRLRHLPGTVCLACRDVWAPEIEPTESLIADIEACVAGAPRRLHILKARPANRGDGSVCEGCGGRMEAAAIDVALGEGAGLVIAEVPGLWCWNCHMAVFPDSGESIRARLSHFDHGDAGRVVPSLCYDTVAHPTSVQLEVTTRCNLACTYCSHRFLDNKRDVPVADIERMLDRIDFSMVDNVDFTGLGEPVLHRGLADVVRAVLARGTPSHRRVVTNGTAMTRKVFEPLCAAGINSFAFSIDSLDAEHFARSRGNGRLQDVLENLEALVAFRETQGLHELEIKIKAVLLEEPYAEAESLLRYSARLGIEMPHFSCLDSRANARPNYTEPWLRDPFAGDSSATFQVWTQARWRELGGNTTPPRSGSEPSPAARRQGFSHPLLRPPGLCRWAVDAAFVSADATMLPCCEQMIDLPRRGHGALADHDLGHLWNHALLWAYRLPLSLGRVPSGCVGCTWAPVHGQPL